jgi:hypothetical protein
MEPVVRRHRVIHRHVHRDLPPRVGNAATPIKHTKSYHPVSLAETGLTVRGRNTSPSAGAEARA